MGVTEYAPNIRPAGQLAWRLAPFSVFRPMPVGSGTHQVIELGTSDLGVHQIPGQRKNKRLTVLPWHPPLEVEVRRQGDARRHPPVSNNHEMMLSASLKQGCSFGREWIGIAEDQRVAAQIVPKRLLLAT